MTTITSRAQHALDVLQDIEQHLPIGDCNGRYQRSFADAVALLGKPIEDYTVAELLALSRQHAAQWIEGDAEQRAFHAALCERRAEVHA